MAQYPLRKDDLPNTPPPKLDNRWHYPYTRVSGSMVDVSASAEGRYGGYFASADGGRANHVFEFITTHPVTTTEAGRIHGYGRWVIATLASAKATANFGAAIASASLGGAGSGSSNRFRADTRGIDDAHWSELRELSGSLTTDSVKGLGGGLAQAIGWCVTEAKTGTSEPGAVVEVVPPSYDTVRSTVFALNRIKRGDSREAAERFLDDKLSRRISRRRHVSVDPLTIAATYHRLGLRDAQAPTQEQERLAARILRGQAPMPAARTEVAGYWFEVEPFRMSDGSVPSLARLAPGKPARTKVNDWPIATALLSPSQGNTGGSVLHVQTAVRVGASGIVDLGLDVDARYWTYGFLAHYAVDGVAGSLVLNEKYGAGFRVRLRSSGSDAELDVPAIAAKATLELLQVSYEIESIGLSLGGLAQLPAVAVASVGKFGVDTLNAVGALYRQASDILSNHRDPSFQPLLTAVQLDLGAPEIQALVASGDEIEARAEERDESDDEREREGAGARLIDLGD
jgi:hypothetical protein